MKRRRTGRIQYERERHLHHVKKRSLQHKGIIPGKQWGSALGRSWGRVVSKAIRKNAKKRKKKLK